VLRNSSDATAEFPGGRRTLRFFACFCLSQRCSGSGTVDKVGVGYLSLAQGPSQLGKEWGRQEGEREGEGGLGVCEESERRGEGRAKRRVRTLVLWGMVCLVEWFQLMVGNN